MDPGYPITFVCCIEHGRLEHETLLMLRTLRRNGGASANARVLVVVARYGAALGSVTISELKRLAAELIYASRENVASWFNYSNKVAAVGVAERLSTTPLIAWLDSDVLIAAEPRGLIIEDGTDFAGRCEFLPPAVRDADKTQVPYWDRLCAQFGISLADLPLVPMPHVETTVRLNFNSGVFVWRRGSRFAVGYRQAFIRLLDSRLAQHSGEFFTADQVIISPLLISERIAWLHLDTKDHHMVFPGQIEGSIAAPNMKDSNVIHYSKSLKEPFRQRFLARLANELPDLHEFIVSGNGAYGGKSAGWPRLVDMLLKIYRKVRWEAYALRIDRAPMGVNV